MALTLGAKAQGITFPSASFIQTTFSGRIVDSLTNEPLPSAVISVVSKHRSGAMKVRNLLSDQKGNFSFDCNPNEQNRMEVAVLGYKPHIVELYTDEPEQNLGLIRLSQSTQAIDEVVVKARIQMYKMKGDTIIYQPRAVNTMKDDPMLEILRHMPGVEVNAGGGVSILGQPVERAYVNQKLLFGNNPTTALKELDAKEVASIMVYDEVDEADAVINGENARKRKVINITTFKDFIQSQKANVRGEAGMDFNANAEGRRPMRYQGSGEIGFYSEALQLAASGGSDNLIPPNSAQKSMRKSDATAFVSGKSGTAHNYNANYHYNSSVNETLSTAVSNYFPTDYFTSQHTVDSTRNQSESSRHALSGGYSYQTEKFKISTSLTAGLLDENSLQEQLQSIRRDGVLMSTSHNKMQQANRYRTLSWSANSSRRFQNNNSLHVNVQTNLVGGAAQGLRLEKRMTEGQKSLFDWDVYTPAPDNTVTGNVSYGLNFDKAGTLSFSSGMNYVGQMARQIYTDRQTGERDWIRSEDAFDKTLTWIAETSYNLNRKNSTFSAQLRYNLENRTYEDYKVNTTDQRLFHHINGRVSYRYTRPKKNLTWSFYNKYDPVMTANFSSRINDSNPLYVSTGNRSLVPTGNYSFAWNGDFMGRKSSYGIDVNLTLVTNPILQRRIFFKEATALPDRPDYVMQAGSTLISPENGATYLSLSVSGNYKVRIAPLRLFLDMQGFYYYANPEEKLYGQATRSHRHQFNLGTTLTTNFSSQFRIRLNNTIGIELQERFGNSSRTVRDELKASAQWDMLQNLSLSTDYTGIFQSSVLGYDIPTTHLLNASMSYRLLKERARIGLNAYNVLNNTVPIKIRQSLQAITTNTNPNSSSYFTISFEYKFNNRRNTN